jgi:hypothetical protein
MSDNSTLRTTMEALEQIEQADVRAAPAAAAEAAERSRAVREVARPGAQQSDVHDPRGVAGVTPLLAELDQRRRVIGASKQAVRAAELQHDQAQQDAEAG